MQKTKQNKTNKPETQNLRTKRTHLLSKISKDICYLVVAVTREIQFAKIHMACHGNYTYAESV